jgi:hypothetical protein
MSPGPVSHIHRSPFTVLPLINPPMRYTDPSLLEVALTAAPYLGNGFVCDTVKFNFRCDQGYGELFSSAFSGGGVRLCRDPSRGVCEGYIVSRSSIRPISLLSKRVSTYIVLAHIARPLLRTWNDLPSREVCRRWSCFHGRWTPHADFL